MIKIVLFCLALCTINAVWGQDILSDHALILYELDRTPGKYVFCANFQTPKKDTISHVVIGDTFKVKSDGVMCLVIMSNAYVLNTKYSPSLTNDLEEYHVLLGVYVNSFPKDAKLIFNNSVYKLSKFELSKAKIEALDDTNIDETDTTVYKGKAALDQLKKMGLGPPDDMDEKKADGN